MTDTRLIRTGPSVPRDDASSLAGLAFLACITALLFLVGRAWMAGKPVPERPAEIHQTEPEKAPEPCPGLPPLEMEGEGEF